MAEKVLTTILLGGARSGITKTKMSNWNGLIFSSPRDKLSELLKEPKVQSSGVYLLIGQDEDNPLKTAIYVGESDSVANRFRQHLSDERKDFAGRFLVAVAGDNSLSKTKVKELEAKLVSWAHSQQNLVVKNSTTPSGSNLDDFDKAEIAEFLRNVLIVLEHTGIGFSDFAMGPVAPAISGAPKGAFEASNIVTKDEIGDDPKPWFVFEVGNAKAIGRPDNRGFLVQEGSTAAKSSGSLVNRDAEYRELLVRDQILQEHPLRSNLLVFSKDHRFPSSSKAAGVVKDGNCSGPSNWKIPDTGQTLRDWEIAKLEISTA